MRETDPSTEDDVRWELLQRSGLVDDRPRPELARWTAVLRRATGSAVAAQAGRRAGCAARRYSADSSHQ